MNIHIVKNLYGTKGENLDDNFVLRISEENSQQFPGLMYRKMYIYNLKKNVNIEVEPDIKKYNIVVIEDVQFNKNSIFFASVRRNNNCSENVTVSIYRYDYIRNINMGVIYEYEEKIQKYAGCMRTRLFILNEDYFIRQDEYTAKNFSGECEGYFKFELKLCCIKSGISYEISDKRLNQWGIACLKAITPGISVIKTGYDLMGNDRYKKFSDDEAALESLGLVHNGQLISDIIIGNGHVAMEVLEQARYNTTISNVMTKGDYLCYSKISFYEDLRDEKYFYNLRTKKSIKCVSADENSSNVQGTIVDGKCYMLVKKAKNWEFLPVDGPDGKYMLGSQYDIADICLGVVIATEQKKNLFGKERNYVCAINFPDMRVIHKEKGKYEGYVISADGTVNIFIK